MIFVWTTVTQCMNRYRCVTLLSYALVQSHVFYKRTIGKQTNFILCPYPDFMNHIVQILQSGIRIPVAENVQTEVGARPTFYQMGTSVLSWGLSGWDVDLHLALSLWMSAARTLLPLCDFRAWRGTTLPLLTRYSTHLLISAKKVGYSNIYIYIRLFEKKYIYIYTFE